MAEQRSTAGHSLDHHILGHALHLRQLPSPRNASWAVKFGVG